MLFPFTHIVNLSSSNLFNLVCIKKVTRKNYTLGGVPLSCDFIDTLKNIIHYIYKVSSVKNKWFLSSNRWHVSYPDAFYLRMMVPLRDRFHLLLRAAALNSCHALIKCRLSQTSLHGIHHPEIESVRVRNIPHYFWLTYCSTLS